MADEVYRLSGFFIPFRYLRKALLCWLDIRASFSDVARKEHWLDWLKRKLHQWFMVQKVLEMLDAEGKCDPFAVSADFDLGITLEECDNVVVFIAPHCCERIILEVASKLDLILTVDSFSKTLEKGTSLMQLYENADCVLGTVVDRSLGTCTCQRLAGFDGEPWIFRIEGDRVYLSGSPIAKTALQNICLGLFSL
ncbi:MAG TPA: hypothetical protein PKG74_00255 [Candidatus Colwellbacteria bacterium]|nr:hypothetical protein [Candidatus Colwellbacteria bacterium]